MDISESIFDAAVAGAATDDFLHGYCAQNRSDSVCAAIADRAVHTDAVLLESSHHSFTSRSTRALAAPLLYYLLLLWLTLQLHYKTGPKAV